MSRRPRLSLGGQVEILGLLPGGGLRRWGQTVRRGRTPKYPPPEAGLFGGCRGSCGCSPLGSLATRALAPPSGRPGRKQEAGAACAAGLLSRGAEARAPRLLLYSALRRQRQLLSPSCPSAPRPGRLLSRGPWRRPSRPSPAPSHLWSPPPRPQPRMALCNGDSKVSLWRGGPCLTASGRRQGSGPGSHRVESFPCFLPLASASNPAARQRRRVGERAVGACGCFLLGSGRCFVDFCLRVGVPRACRALGVGEGVSFPRPSPGPRLPGVAMGRPRRAARRVGVGSERVCVCVSE